MFSVSGSSRRPWPALRIIALGFLGLLPVIFVKVKVHKVILIYRAEIPGSSVPRFERPDGIDGIIKTLLARTISA